MSVTPAGQDMLVLSAAGLTLDSYTINRLTGCLTWVNTLAIPPGPQHVFADPFGRFGYVTNSVATTVQPYSITPAGVIAPILPAVALPAGTAPEGLRVDQTGKFLYIALPGTSQIAGYSINAITGKLAPIPLSPWATFVPAAAPSAVHAITP
jgi:6-phosphogluconolactonase (cycloisomerase 2 family)